MTTTEQAFRVANMEPYGKDGHSWTVVWADPSQTDTTYGDPFGENGDSRDYRTDSQGCGLWIWSDLGAGEWRQVLGGCQFSLHQSTQPGRIRAVARMHRR